MTGFKIGDRVKVRRLKKAGLIEQIRRDGYRVSVGSLQISCQEADLEKLAEQTTPEPTVVFGDLPPASKVIREMERLDLHGMTVDDALRAVEARIDKAVLAGLDRIEIMHGIGSGRIRDALHRFLPTLRPVRSFKADEINAGITWVYL